MFKEIKEQYNYEFSIFQQGIYTILIEASCENGKILGLFGGEDLRVEINSIKSREIPAKGRAQHFNIPPAWNGTKLKGKTKTIVFVLKLDKGRHNIKFIPNNGAIINKKPAIEPFTANILKNIQSEESNRQPWITISLIDLPLHILNVSATCEKRKYDSDDVKLVIDGQIQKNDQSNWWGKNWYFSGRQLEGKTKEARFYPNLPQGIHYLEFWADRKPFLNLVQIDLGIDAPQTEEEDKEYSEPEIRIPGVADPEWTGDFNDDTEQMLLARAIFGEARQVDFSDKLRIAIGWSIKNRVASPQWANTYHKVILEEAQYSAFNEEDVNLPFVKDPLSGDEEAWKSCYKIAGQIMNGEIKDPSDGANHYFSDFIEYPEWTKSPQAKFKIKIDNTLFYDLDWTQSGFSILLLVFIFTAYLFCGGLCYKAIAYSNENYPNEKVIKAESYNHFFINPKTEELNKLEFDEKGEFLRMKKITNNGYSKIELKRFSDSEALGYFQYLHKREDPKWNYCKDNVALMIMPDENSEPYEIYRGDCHTSYWELSGHNNKHAIVYWNCGTDCLYAYEINIMTGEVEAEYHK